MFPEIYLPIMSSTSARSLGNVMRNHGYRIAVLFADALGVTRQTWLMFLQLNSSNLDVAFCIQILKRAHPNKGRMRLELRHLSVEMP